MEELQNINLAIKTMEQRQQLNEEESLYDPEVEKVEIKIKESRRKSQGKKKVIYNSSSWSLEENVLYKEFIQKNYQMFEMSECQRRLMKINVLLSSYVKSRSSKQCRSHHQKMLTAYKSINAIIARISSLQLQQHLKEQRITESIKTPGETMCEMRQINQSLFIPFQDVWQMQTQKTSIEHLLF